MSLLRRGLILVVLAAATSVGLAACEHTVRGVGSDMQENGKAVKDAAS